MTHATRLRRENACANQTDDKVFSTERSKENAVIFDGHRRRHATLLKTFGADRLPAADWFPDFDREGRCWNESFLAVGPLMDDVRDMPPIYAALHARVVDGRDTAALRLLRRTRRVSEVIPAVVPSPGPSGDIKSLQRGVMTERMLSRYNKASLLEKARARNVPMKYTGPDPLTRMTKAELIRFILDHQ